MNKLHDKTNPKYILKSSSQMAYGKHSKIDIKIKPMCLPRAMMVLAAFSSFTTEANGQDSQQVAARLLASQGRVRLLSRFFNVEH